MELFVGLSVVIGAVWLSGYGAAMIVQQHGRYVSFSRRGARWFGSQAMRGIRWVWRHYHVQITWMTIGFFLALALLGRMPHN